MGHPNPFKGHKIKTTDLESAIDAFRADMAEWITNHVPRVPEKTRDGLDAVEVADLIQRTGERALTLRVNRQNDRTSVNPESIKEADRALREAVEKVNDLAADPREKIDASKEVKAMHGFMKEALGDSRTLTGV